MQRKPQADSKVAQSFAKGEYRGLDVNKMVIRPGALAVLRAPSRFGNMLLPYNLIFDKEK